MKSATKFARNGLLAGLFAVGLITQAHAVAVYGVAQGSTTSLVTFDSNSPSTVLRSVGISGVAGTVLSIDVRPATGELYALSSTNGLYTINPTTGAATLVATLSVPISGTATIDFNPTVDRLRIVTSSGQNFRVVPTTGAVTVDGPIAFAVGDANAGDAPSVVGIAYTNSFAGATTTALFDFEIGNNILASQSPPNNGTLNTIGALGATGLSGFDIFAFGNQGFASSFSNFYGVNLLTGGASLIGSFASGLRITDIAVTQVPEPATVALLGAGLFALTLNARRKRTGIKRSR